MRTKYRIKQEVLKNGEVNYTIQKKFLFWWKSYFLYDGFGGCMLQYDHLQEALDILESLEESDRLIEGRRVVKVKYLYKEDRGE